MQKLGGNVSLKLYPNLAHTVNLDELRFIRTMMGALITFFDHLQNYCVVLVLLRLAGSIMRPQYAADV